MELKKVVITMGILGFLCSAAAKSVFSSSEGENVSEAMKFLKGYQSSVVKIPALESHNWEFDLKDKNDVWFNVSAMYVFRALSNSGGAMVVEVNGEKVDNKSCINQQEKYTLTPVGGVYTADAYTLLAAPSYELLSQSKRIEEYSYLFNISSYLKNGSNKITIKNVAKEGDIAVKNLVLFKDGKSILSSGDASKAGGEIDVKQVIALLDKLETGIIYKVRAQASLLAEFSLAEKNTVYLNLDAVYTYGSPSASGGVLRIKVNNTILSIDDSLNKKGNYFTQPTGNYVSNAWGLPAGPDMKYVPEKGFDNYHYLFDITPYVKTGRNEIIIENAAGTEANEMMTRNILLVTGKGFLEGKVQERGIDFSSDPTSLEPEFITIAKKNEGVFLAQDFPQIVYLTYANVSVKPVKSGYFMIDVPAGVNIIPYFTQNFKPLNFKTVSKKRENLDYVSYQIDFPPDFYFSPSVSWKNLAGRNSPPLFLSLYFKALCAPGNYQIYYRLGIENKSGEEKKVDMRVLPAISPQEKPKRNDVGFWTYYFDPKDKAEEFIKAYCSIGVNKILTNDVNVLNFMHAYGGKAYLTSGWNFENTVYPTSTSDSSKACIDISGNPVTDGKVKGTKKYLWCPSYMALNPDEVFAPITVSLKSGLWDGYALDLEGVHPICYCQRCRKSFQEYAKIDSVEWPADVKEGGAYYAKFIDFHCYLNSGKYLEGMKKAVKEAGQQIIFGDWQTGVNNEPEGLKDSPFIKDYQARNKEDRETGYEWKYGFQIFDRVTLANGVYPQNETTWDYAYGLTWALKRMEMAVRNPGPVGTCINIGRLFDFSSYTNFDYLRFQSLTHIAQGAKGIEYWYSDELDGRHYQLLSRMANIYNRGEKFFWEGKRVKPEDTGIKIAKTEKILPYIYKLADSYLVIFCNRDVKNSSVKLDLPKGYSLEDLETGRNIASQQEIPALDVKFIVVKK